MAVAWLFVPAVLVPLPPDPARYDLGPSGNARLDAELALRRAEAQQQYEVMHELLELDGLSAVNYWPVWALDCWAVSDSPIEYELRLHRPLLAGTHLSLLLLGGGWLAWALRRRRRVMAA